MYMPGDKKMRILLTTYTQLSLIENYLQNEYDKIWCKVHIQLNSLPDITQDIINVPKFMYLSTDESHILSVTWLRWTKMCLKLTKNMKTSHILILMFHHQLWPLWGNLDSHWCCSIAPERYSHDGSFGQNLAILEQTLLSHVSCPKHPKKLHGMSQ